MRANYSIKTQPTLVGKPRQRRSMADLLEPLEAIASNSVSLIANHGARFEMNGELYELPRYLFIGPKGGDDPIRLGIFATVHGDETEGAHALVQFARRLERCPEMARGYCLFLYPVCNPTGYEDNTRTSRRGRDLNREFWNHSGGPEIVLETPQAAPQYAQVQALTAALTSILSEYRKLIAYAANL